MLRFVVVTVSLFNVDLTHAHSSHAAFWLFNGPARGPQLIRLSWLLIGYPTAGCGESVNLPPAGPEPHAGLPRHVLGGSTPQLQTSPAWFPQPTPRHHSRSLPPTNSLLVTPALDAIRLCFPTSPFLVTSVQSVLHRPRHRHHVVSRWRRVLDLRQPPQPVSETRPR